MCYIGAVSALEGRRFRRRRAARIQSGSGPAGRLCARAYSESGPVTSLCTVVSRLRLVVCSLSHPVVSSMQIHSSLASQLIFFECSPRPILAGAAVNACSSS